MKHDIPTTVGILILGGAALGCSDAQKLANAYEDVCKADCECPGTGWTHVSNCKNACEGYAKILEAEFEEAEDEACAELDDILDAIRDCAKKSCANMDACLGPEYARLYECWPGYVDYYNVGAETAQEIEATLAALSRPISRPLLRQALYSAAYHDAESEENE